MNQDKPNTIVGKALYETGRATGKVVGTLENKIDKLKEGSFDKLADVAYYFVFFMIAGLSLMIILSLLSVAAVLGLEKVMDSYIYPILIVAGSYIVFLAIIYIFRESIQDKISDFMLADLKD